MAIRRAKEFDFDLAIGGGTKFRPKVLHAAPHVHEMGEDYSESDMTTPFEVPASRQPTTIVFRSVVLPPTGSRRASPGYLASLRRRKTKAVEESIVSLSQHAEGEGFALWTEKIVEDLRKVIQFLSDEEQFSDPPCEANSCEVLRQIRDSFLNGGWEQYRRPEVRTAALQAIRRLSDQVEVSGQDVDAARKELIQAGLDTAVFPIEALLIDEYEEVPD